MRKKNIRPRKMLTLALFALIFTLTSIFGILDFTTESENSIVQEENPLVDEEKPLEIKKELKTSASITYKYILDTNWSVAASQWWCSGSGIESDPYVIGDLTIDGQNQYSCITIENSTAFFIIENCTFTNIGSLNSQNAGIKLINSSNGLIYNNTCSTNFDGNYGIHLFANCDWNNISENTVNNLTYGIIVQDACDNNTVSRNTANNNNKDGIMIQGFTGAGHVNYDNNVTGNTLFNNSQNGLFWNYSWRGWITENLIHNNSDDGIYCWASGYANISYNILINNSDNGLYLSSSDYSTLKKNIASNNSGHGMYIDLSSRNNIINNTVSYNDDDGIRISGGDYNLLTRNVIHNNTNGLKIIWMGTQAENNIVYKNYFLGNDQYQAVDDGLGTVWNYTYVNNYWSFTYGNYWSDHSTGDSNDDGIDDTPYTSIWDLNAPTWDSVDWVPIYGNPFHNGSGIAIDGDGTDGITWEHASTRAWCNGEGNVDAPFTIEDLVINALNLTSGIYIESSSVYYRIENCTIYNSTTATSEDAGISLNNGAHNGTVTGCTIFDNGIMGGGSAHGIYSYSSDQLTITNNSIYNNSGQGIYTNAEESIFSGNYIANNTGSGIRFGSGYINSTFDRNIVEKNLGHGIYLGQSDNCTISNNYVFNNGLTDIYNGIHITGAESNNITGNTVKFNKGYGIEFSTNCKWNYIYLNLFEKNNYSSLSEYEDNSNYNYWNNSKYGNYWYRYYLFSEDANDDGFGDDPWLINGHAGVFDYKPIYDDGFNCSAIYVNEASWNDWAWWETRTWMRGAGTEGDPYLLKDLEIDAGGASSSYCIRVDWSEAYFKIENCTLTNAGSATGAIYLFHTNNSEIIDNNCSFNAGDAIYLSTYSCNNVISRNIIHNNTASTPFKRGIRIQDDSSHNFVSENWIYNNTGANRQGITLLTQSNFNTIYNNTIIENDGNGIGTSVSDYNTINLNTMRNNTLKGIYLATGSDHNIISNNIVDKNNETGIYCNGGISDISNNSILNNNITFNGQSGIELGKYRDSLISGNNISDNGRNGDYAGIKVDFASLFTNFTLNIISNHAYGGLNISTGCTNHRLWNNTFSGNGFNALDNGANSEWDNGNIGNYWDDYTGWDTNGDGIGETLYDVPGSAMKQDHYPIWYKMDTISPVITIIKPLSGLFGSSAPDFNITFIEYQLEKTWYTIDNGLNNYTFTGVNGTINQTAWDLASSGLVTIRFYAKDLAGNIGTNVTTVSLDKLAPVITINSPLAGGFFYGPPLFNLSIVETYLVAVWYTIDGSGEYEVNLTSLTGMIDGVAWNDLTDKNVTIVFYARDSIGNTGSATLIAEKRTTSGGDVLPISPEMLTTIMVGSVAGVAVLALLLVVRARKKPKEKKRDVLATQREEVTEDDISVSKEQHFCLVHKGKIEGYSFICPGCGAYYCANCVEALKQGDNECWSCTKAIDPTKPTKSQKPEESEDKPMVDKGKKAKQGKKDEGVKSLEDYAREQPAQQLSIRREPSPESALSDIEIKMKAIQIQIKEATDSLQLLEESFKSGQLTSEEYINKKMALAEKLGNLTGQLEQLKP